MRDLCIRLLDAFMYFRYETVRCVYVSSDIQ